MPRKPLSCVASGHARWAGDDGSILVEYSSEDDGGPTTVLKRLDECELKLYQLLSESFRGDPIQDFIPTFHGVVEDFDEAGCCVARYIRMHNALTGFDQPKVMDIKLGNRTFMESECGNPKLRPDLYKRMASMYPELVTDAEEAVQAITKQRWMTVRDNNSTILTLGYRIDGVAGSRSEGRRARPEEPHSFRTLDETCDAFRAFAEMAAMDDGECSECAAPLLIADSLRRRIRDMRDAAAASPMLRRREFIGSSMLLVADHVGRVGVFWIDFAKSCLAPDVLEITHRRPWILGNHEDGLLLGLDNMVEAWDHVAATLRSELAALNMDQLDCPPSPDATCADVALSTCLPPQKLRNTVDPNGSAVGAAAAPASAPASDREPGVDR